MAAPIHKYPFQGQASVALTCCVTLHSKASPYTRPAHTGNAIIGILYAQ